MSALLPLSFGSPLVLGGLLILPLIWWLLRVTPPRPDVEVFPPLKILAKVLKNEVTPRKTPWWLLLLRLALAAFIILALADPVLNPVTRLASGSGPLAIVVDNGWPSARLAETPTAHGKQPDRRSRTRRPHHLHRRHIRHGDRRDRPV